MNYLNIENPMIAAAQRQMDAEGELQDYEESKWEQVWDEIDAAANAGLLSSWVTALIEKAVEKAGELPEPEEMEIGDDFD